MRPLLPLLCLAALPGLDLDLVPTAIRAEAGMQTPTGRTGDATGHLGWYLGAACELGGVEGLFGRCELRASGRGAKGLDARIDTYGIGYQEIIPVDRDVWLGLGLGANWCRSEYYGDGGAEVRSGLRPSLRGLVGARLWAEASLEAWFEVVSGSVDGYSATSAGVGLGWRFGR